jgi:glucose/arabinose dehydrogenase
MKTIRYFVVLVMGLLFNENSYAKYYAPKDSAADYYTVENIPLPDGLIAETGAIGFMPDGRFIACFHRGEIMTYNLKTKKWKLFAEGLHDPLGILVVSDREILIMQRPELTRIRDTDGDGVADDYETVTDDFGLSGNYHEFAFGPVADKQGNLYIALNLASNGAGIRKEIRGKYDSLSRPGRMYSCVPYRGWIMKLTKDGKLHPYAVGFRSPNSLGFDAQGRLFVSDNQGDWLGTSKLFHVEEGKFYGHPAGLIWKEDFPRVVPIKLPVAQLDSMRTKEAIQFPHGYFANSPTQPIWDNTKGKFGPFAGQMIVGDMDHKYVMRILPEEVGGALQGACIPMNFGSKMRIGNNRLVFASDGSLWVGQNDHGWAGSRGIQRISWKGKTHLDILAMNLTKTGFDLTFTLPLNEEAAKDLANYKFKRFYYEYHQAYGSKQFDVQDVPVKSIKLSADRKKVSIELAEMKAGYVYELRTGDIKTNDEKYLFNNLICYSLNKLRD